MGKRREAIKTLTRRKEYLGNKLQVEEYSGRNYDLAEYNALVFALRGLENQKEKK